jgi:hypothetical protein
MPVEKLRELHSKLYSPALVVASRLEKN